MLVSTTLADPMQTHGDQTRPPGDPTRASADLMQASGIYFALGICVGYLCWSSRFHVVFVNFTNSDYPANRTHVMPPV